LANPESLPPNSGYGGLADIHAGNGPFNPLYFLVQQLLSRISTMKLVQVKAVTSAGELAVAGTVDVQPLVNQIDAGSGVPIPHGRLHSLQYFRIQGGSNAVIIDPVVGDIGLAIFADRDISKVTKTKKQANPGSFRSFDMADGIYLGGILNGLPNQFIRFASDGLHLSPVSGGKIFLEGDVEQTGNFTSTGNITAGQGGGDQVGLQTHKHPTAAAGSPSSPTPGT